jgi:hypothetical protein
MAGSNKGASVPGQCGCAAGLGVGVTGWRSEVSAKLINLAARNYEGFLKAPRPCVFGAIGEK